MIDYKLLNQLLYDGRADEVRALVQQALSEGRPADEVLAKGLIDGMRIVGERFKHNRFFVPQVLVAARAMKAGMAVLKPLLTKTTVAKPVATVVMDTVKGDLHDIGKNLVCMLCEGAGLRVIDAFREEGLDHVELCVGGAPLNEGFADEIGAHGYAADASSAVELFTQLCPASG